MYYIQNYFFYLSKILLEPEIPLFGITLKIWNPENENIEFSKNIFQVPLNETSTCTK